MWCFPFLFSVLIYPFLCSPSPISLLLIFQEFLKSSNLLISPFSFLREVVDLSFNRSLCHHKNNVVGNEIENYVCSITLIQMLSFGFCNKRIVSELAESRFNEVVKGMQNFEG